MLKLFFYLVNLIFIFFYLFPGSILGKIFYGDFSKQPHLTNDFRFSVLDISSNHFYAYFLISFLGFFIYFKNFSKQIILYLFLNSLILEFLHIVIPNRFFQFADLNGNVLGVVVSLILFQIYFYAKKNFN